MSPTESVFSFNEVREVRTNRYPSPSVYSSSILFTTERSCSPTPTPSSQDEFSGTEFIFRNETDENDEAIGEISEPVKTLADLVNEEQMKFSL